MPTKKTEQTPDDVQDTAAPETTEQPRYRCVVRVLGGGRVFEAGDAFEGTDEQIAELLGCGAIEQVAS